MSDEPLHLKFYTDTHIAKAVAEQLRQRGIDAVHCEEVGMADASDPEHLEYATKEGRVMVSHDRDFQSHHYEWLAEGKPHAGIISVSRRLQGTPNIGRIVTTLAEYHQLIAEGAGTVEADIANQLIEIR
jgi:predicted nuclease of predicted toxin-antitoxin system